MMKLPIEKATLESGTLSVSAAMGSAGLLLALAGAAREAAPTYPEDTEAKRLAEGDATIDAEDILMQAEEANALDPVG